MNKPCEQCEDIIQDLKNELKAVEAMYRMNRKWIETAKLEIASLKEDLAFARKVDVK